MSRDPLTIAQRDQLRRKVATGEYTQDEAFEIIYWMIQRKAGYP